MLSDSERRKEYDEVRRMVESGGYSHFPGAGPGRGSPFGGQVNLEDLLGGFGDVFGRADQQANAGRGADLTAKTRITFEEFPGGGHQVDSVRGQASCPACRGTGARVGTTPEVCSACSGWAPPSRIRVCSPSADLATGVGDRDG